MFIQTYVNTLTLTLIDNFLVCPHCSSKVSTPSESSGATTARYTMCQVRRHSRREDCWLVAHGKVYDATGFIDSHPAGPRPILARAGTDCTVDYDFHSVVSQTKVWKPLCIGKTTACPLKDGPRPSLFSPNSSNACTIQ